MCVVHDSRRDFEDASRLPHLLWEVSARAQSLTAAALVDTPLSSASSGVLDAISATPGTSIAEMAQWLPRSPQGLSQVVSRLERLGFVERRLGARGYGVALFLTPDGDRAREDANRRFDHLEVQLAEALGDEDRASLLELLDRARIVLERLDGATEPTAQAATAQERS